MIGPNGVVDPAYGTGGVASMPPFTHFFPGAGSHEVSGFLDEDGLIVESSPPPRAR
mgnify:CR=1 FL=1